MSDAPKNIRQIGNVDISHKIYVEDYVITYTKGIGDELKEDGECNGKAAVLLGHKNINEKDVETYINGLAMIDNFSISGEDEFSNEMWSSIYDVIKTYYEDEEIVGWLYIGENIDAEKDKRLIDIHTGNFNGKNLIFMYYNTDEREEEFYDYMNNSFLKRKGFYIYYQKNDTMHNYMVAMNGSNRNEQECDDHVVKDVRSILSKRQEKYEARKMMKSVYAASMLVAAVALLVGTTVIYNYNSEQTTVPVAEYGVEDMVGPFVIKNEENASPDGEQAAVAGEDNSTSGEQNVQETGAQPAEGQTVPAGEDNSTSGEQDAQETGAQPAEGQTAPAGEDNSTSGEQNVQETGAQPAEEITPAADESQDSKLVTASKTYSFYIVKPGDTLGRIAEKIYNSIYYVNKIKELNSLEDENTIFSGQRLMLPER